MAYQRAAIHLGDELGMGTIRPDRRATAIPERNIVWMDAVQFDGHWELIVRTFDHLRYDGCNERMRDRRSLRGKQTLNVLSTIDLVVVHEGIVANGGRIIS